MVWLLIKDRENEQSNKRCFEVSMPRRLLIGSLFLGCVFLAESFVTPAYARPLRDGDVVVAPDKTAATWATKWAEIAQSIEENGFLTAITSAWKSYNTLFGDNMFLAGDKESAWAKTAIASTAVQTEIETDAMQALADSQTSNVLLSQRVKDAINQTGTLPSDQFLCNVLVARQAPPVMIEFARMMSNIIRGGIDATYRGPTDNGAGPQFYADRMADRCSEYMKTVNPIDRPTKPECEADIMASGHETADADISYSSLSRDYTYQIPPLKLVDQTINGQTTQVLTFVPDKNAERDYDAQVRWIRASQYCYTVAGPRPTPPSGKNMKSEDGKRKRAQFDECRAKQNLFIKQCTDRLAMLTRPNCDMPEMQAFCDVSEDSCAAAREAAIDLSPAYNDCRHGLSLYEIENLSNEMCGSPRRLQTEGLAGAQEDDKIRILAMCGQLKGAWEERIANEDATFATAVQGARQIQDCFDAIRD